MPYAPKTVARGALPHRHRSRQRVSHFVRLRMIEEAGPTCPLCGGDFAHPCHAPEVDHVIPLALGGETEGGNLRVICRTCNRRKGFRLTAPSER